MLLKEQYFPAISYQQLAKDLYQLYPKFSVEEFYQQAIQDLDNLELKQRVKRAAQIIRKFLPDNYEAALEILLAYSAKQPNSFYNIFLPQFVQDYGLDHFDLSLQALKEFTKSSSSEEAIRYFLLSDFAATMRYIKDFAQDENYHVRRLASEGTRPRLPWCIQLKMIKENPRLSLPILEMLKTDPEKYVQKSVANHLNDISKDHADFLAKYLADWDVQQPVTKWIIGHGTRTLVKQGHQETLKLLGYEKAEIAVENFTVPTIVKFGQDLHFSFQLKNPLARAQDLIIDYKISFMRKNGQQNQKVFKLTKCQLAAQADLTLQKYYDFTDKSTRKHYPGEHRLTLLINGQEFNSADFELK